MVERIGELSTCAVVGILGALALVGLGAVLLPILSEGQRFLRWLKVLR